MENDPIIDAAKRDLADLETRRQDIEDFLVRYEKYKGMAQSVPVPSFVGNALETPPPVAVRRSAPADKVMSAVHDILNDRRDALTLTAIFDALLQRGLVIGGKHPKQNLSQKLHAHPAIKSYGKRGWYFTDTVPPCLQTNPRLSDKDDHDYEEGPDTEVPRPLQSNGAAVRAA